MLVPEWHIQRAVARLLRGDVIAYPTEGVWGLGCIPDFEDSMIRILRLKKRSWRQGLILVGSETEQLLPYAAQLTSAEEKTLADNWPGPLTYLVPRAEGISDLIAGDNDTVALRVSNHPIIKALCKSVGPLVSTSANPSGKPAAISRLRLRQYFGVRVDYILPGKLGDFGGASEIRDLRSGVVKRAAIKPGAKRAKIL